MKNLPLASLLGLNLLTLAAGGCTEDTNPIGSGTRPQQTEWKKVVDNLPFPLTGDGAVRSITIGGSEYQENFANRGDVEVYLDQDAEVISVEIRYYDFSDDVTAQGDDTVRGTFERMSLWAFVSSTNPKNPNQMDVMTDCTKGTWKSGCKVLSYYDGLSQPARAGADIRVHLPKAYRGELNITTEDNDAESSFPRLGNITVDGLCSSGDILLAQGEAQVRLCRDLTPAPTCSAEQIKACAEFVDEMGNPAAWSNQCMACTAENFGQLRIEAVKPWAGNITVDIPTTTWLNANLANEETDKPHNCTPALENCAAGVCQVKETSTYSVSGEFNYPSKAAPAGAGFNLTVKSAGCNPVEYFADDKNWSEDEEASKPTVEEHGHVKVCTGCLFQ